MSVNYRAVYVPEQQTRDWETAAALAVSYVEEECREHGVDAVLVTPRVQRGNYNPALDGFVSRHRYLITPASRYRRANPGQLSTAREN